MERSPKRPRLSMFPDRGPDQELDAARFSNDMFLKSRFEAIFKKYSQDFSNVGDEVDVFTGEILVNNGHIESMSGETDTGASKTSGPIASGGSILRAMTVATERDDSYFEDENADDVIISIETIAENAALAGDNESEDDSEDDLLDSSVPEHHPGQPSGDNLKNSESAEPGGEPKRYDSDSDSLFEVHDGQRLSSPDSLFESQEVENITTGLRVEEAPDNDAILAKFGDQIGQEVLQILEKRADAHIEPAWRVPVNIRPEKESYSESHSAIQSFPAIPPTHILASPDQGNSIWARPHYKITKSRPEPGNEPRIEPESDSESAPVSMTNRIRAESEDPLQEDFSPSRDTGWQPNQRLQDDEDGSEYADDEGEQGYADGEEKADEFESILDKGRCPYCDTKFRDRAGVMSHWGRLLRKSGLMEDSIHDLTYIEAFKESRSRRSGGPRLTLEDFKTMVELHEGGGLSFQEISSAEVLRTQKTAAQLHDLFDRHRTSRGWAGKTVPAEPPKRWTEAENNRLQSLCVNPLVTIATLSRKLKGRKEIEIGDKLADEWLSELKARKGNGAALVGYHMSLPAQSPLKYGVVSQRSPNSVRVKSEESEDELF